MKDIKWQLFISLLGAFFYLLYYKHDTSLTLNKVAHVQSLMIFMGLLGSMLALTTSLSLGFIFQFTNTTNSKKHDLIWKFKSMLFDFDSFLQSYPDKLELISRCQELSWDLKSLKNDEFPILNWDERISNIKLEKLLENTKYDKDKNLPNKILGYLTVLEEIISEIGLMCIRQIICGVHMNRVIKGFSYIVILLIIFGITFYAQNDMVLFILSAAPIFFSILTILYFTELGLELYRESDELLVFVDRENNT